MLKFSFPDFSLQPVFQFICFVGVMPLKNLLGPVGDMYCLSNTFRMLVLTIFVSMKSALINLSVDIQHYLQILNIR